MDFDTILYGISIWLLPALIAITFHEAAHGYVALRCGDDTALRAGRVTFNPIKHIDPFGTVILPAILLMSNAAFLFGYAKPVPVNFGRLRNPRRDMVWVAAAGPGVNLLLAVACAVAFHAVSWMDDPTLKNWVAVNLRNAINLNVVLALFNMLPIPPLDGGRVAVGLLPDALAYPLARLEPWGMFIIIGALFILPMIGWQLGMNLNIFSWLLTAPKEYLITLIAWLTGH